MRVMSEYERAWRKAAGHPVPADGVLHDDDELEQLTAPSGAGVTAPPPAAAVAIESPAPAPASPPAKPTGKK